MGAIWMQMKIVVKDFTASFPIQKASTWTEMCDSSTNDENFFETANLSCFLLPNGQGWPICPTVNLFGNPRPTKQTGPMSQLLMNCVEIHWSAFRLINSAGILTKRSEDPKWSRGVTTVISGKGQYGDRRAALLLPLCSFHRWKYGRATLLNQPYCVWLIWRTRSTTEFNHFTTLTVPWTVRQMYNDITIDISNILSIQVLKKWDFHWRWNIDGLSNHGIHIWFTLYLSRLHCHQWEVHHHPLLHHHHQSPIYHDGES